MAVMQRQTSRRSARLRAYRGRGPEGRRRILPLPRRSVPQIPAADEDADSWYQADTPDGPRAATVH